MLSAKNYLCIERCVWQSQHVGPKRPTEAQQAAAPDGAAFITQESRQGFWRVGRRLAAAQAGLGPAFLFPEALPRKTEEEQ